MYTAAQVLMHGMIVPPRSYESSWDQSHPLTTSALSAWLRLLRPTSAASRLPSAPSRTTSTPLRSTSTPCAASFGTSAAYFGSAAVYFDTAPASDSFTVYFDIVHRVGSIRDFDSFRLSTAQPAASTASTPFGCFVCFNYFNTLRMLRLLRLLQHCSDASATSTTPTLFECLTASTLGGCAIDINSCLRHTPRVEYLLG